MESPQVTWILCALVRRMQRNEGLAGREAVGGTCCPLAVILFCTWGDVTTGPGFGRLPPPVSSQDERLRRWGGGAPVPLMILRDEVGGGDRWGVPAVLSLPSLPALLPPSSLARCLWRCSPCPCLGDSCVPLLSLWLGVVAEAVRHLGSLWSLCSLPFLFRPANSKARVGLVGCGQGQVLGRSPRAWVEAPFFQTLVLGLVLAACAPQVLLGQFLPLQTQAGPW